VQYRRIPDDIAPQPERSAEDVVPDFTEFRRIAQFCVEEHYGAELGPQLISAMFGLPLIGKKKGAGFFGGASDNMTVSSVWGQRYLGRHNRMTTGSLGTRRIGSFFGRTNYITTWGFAFYDLTSITLCVASYYNRRS
jgi:hypothetical protein